MSFEQQQQQQPSKDAASRALRMRLAMQATTYSAVRRAVVKMQRVDINNGAIKTMNTFISDHCYPSAAPTGGKTASFTLSSMSRMRSRLVVLTTY